MKLLHVVCVCALLAVAGMLRAEERLVTKGGDYGSAQTPIPDTLRFAIESAKSGDVIRVQRGLIVNLFDLLTLQPGQDNVTLTGPDDRVAQIRA